MIEIIPAVLPKSWRELEDGLALLQGVAPAVQVDVVKDIFDGREALPLWDEFDFEIDIFIEPASFVVRAVELGASRIVVHARHASAKEAVTSLQKNRGGDFAVAVGLGLRPTDTPAVVAEYEGLYDYVQVMGIEHEGKQGEPFDPRAVGLVRALRAAHPALDIQVDGAAAAHARELVAAGASRLIVGSAIMQAASPKAAYKELYTLANGS